MANPYTITVIEDIAAADTVKNLLAEEPGRILDEPSRIRVYATRETVDVTTGVTVGRDVLLNAGSPTNIVAAVGTLPSRQDDLLVEGGGLAGQEIFIPGVNADGAAARELRLLVEVIAFEDLGLVG